MSVVAELFAALSLVPDKGSFREGDALLKSGISSLKAFAATAVAAFTVDAIRTFTRDTLEALPAIGDVADQAGVTAESLQRLRFAFENSGSSASELDAGLLKLTKNIGEAGKGNEELLKSFGSLGVKIRGSNGQLRDADEVLLDIADGLAKIEEPAKRAELATGLLGLQGGKLVPGLKQGAAALVELGNRAAELGIVIDRDAIEAAGALDDEINTASATVLGAGRRLVVEFLPVIKQIVGGLTTFALVLSKIPKFVQRNSAVLKGLATVAGLAAGIVGVKLVAAGVTWLATLVALGIGQLAAIASNSTLAASYGLVAGLIDIATLAAGRFLLRMIATAAPILAAGAALAIAVLAIDDLITGLQGGDSFFTRFSGRFSDLKEALFADISPEDSWIVSLLRFLGIVVVDIFGKIDSFFDFFFRGIERISEAVQSFIDDPVAALRTALDFFARAAKFVGGFAADVLDPTGAGREALAAAAPIAVEAIDPFGIARGGIERLQASIARPPAASIPRVAGGNAGGVNVGGASVVVNVDARGNPDGQAIATMAASQSGNAVDQATRAAAVDLLGKG